MKTSLIILVAWGVLLSISVFRDKALSPDKRFKVAMRTVALAAVLIVMAITHSLAVTVLMLFCGAWLSVTLMFDYGRMFKSGLKDLKKSWHDLHKNKR